MKYVAGMQAMNVRNEKTPGDWHRSSVDWENLTFAESDESPFGSWEIEERVMPNGKREQVARYENRGNVLDPAPQRKRIRNRQWAVREEQHLVQGRIGQGIFQVG